MKNKFVGIIIGIMLLIPVSIAIGNHDESEVKQYIINNLQTQFSEDLSIELYTKPGSLGISLDIQNIGTSILTDISWNFKYKTSFSGKGILLNEKSQNGMINELAPEEKQTLNFKPFKSDMSSPLGLADIYLNASASTNECFVRTQMRGSVFLFSILNLYDTYIDIFPAEAYAMMQEEIFDMIIDVSPKYDEGHLPGSVNYYIGDGSLDEIIPSLDKQLTYLVYCHVDSASVPGAQKLIDAGINNVYRLEGNYPAWVDGGYPIEIDEHGYVDITAMEAKEMIDTNPDLIVIDVSPLYDNGHIPGSINYYIGDGSLDAAIPTLDKNKDYLIYCHVDSASIGGAEKMVDAGFNPVYRLEGNFQAWINAGYPIEY